MQILDNHTPHLSTGMTTTKCDLVVLGCCCFLLVATLQTSALTQNVNPGMEVSVTPQAMEFLSKYTKSKLVSFLTSHQTHSLRSSYGQNVQFKLDGLRVTGFNRDDFVSDVWVMPGAGIQWQISELSLTLESRYQARFSRLGGAGIVYIKISKVKLILLMSVDRVTEGHYKTVLDDCQLSNTGDVSVTFSTGWTDRILKTFQKEVNVMAENLMRQHFCEKIKQTILPEFAKKVLTPLSSKAALFNVFHIDFTSTRPLEFADDDSIVSYNKGNVYAVLQHGSNAIIDTGLPFAAPPMPPREPALVSPTDEYMENDGMLRVRFTNYTLGSLLYWMNQFKMFDYEFTKDTDAFLAKYLRTDCVPGDVCAGNMFKTMATRFPKSDLRVTATTTGWPSVTITESAVNITVTSRVRAYVTSRDRSKTNVFLTAKVTIYASITDTKLDDYVLTADIKQEGYALSEVETDVTELLDTTTQDFLVTSLIELVIADDLAAKIRRGIKLPRIMDFDIGGSRVLYEQEGVMTMIADFCHEAEQCAAVRSKFARLAEIDKENANYGIIGDTVLAGSPDIVTGDDSSYEYEDVFKELEARGVQIGTEAPPRRQPFRARRHR